MKLDKKTILGLVKRAYLTAAKDNEIRNNLAYRDITFSWNLEDIGVWFTIEMHRGKVTMKEGRAKEPDMVFCNETVEQFHKGNIEELTGRDMKDSGGFTWSGNEKYLKYISVLCRHMRGHYKEIAHGM